MAAHLQQGSPLSPQLASAPELPLLPCHCCSKGPEPAVQQCPDQPTSELAEPQLPQHPCTLVRSGLQHGLAEWAFCAFWLLQIVPEAVLALADQSALAAHPAQREAGLEPSAEDGA